MIKLGQVFELLIEACPSFTPSWQVHLTDFGNDVLYIAAGSFADHLFALAQANTVDCYSQVGQVIERLLTEGTDEVKALTVIGILEDVQNVLINHNVEQTLFTEHLGRAGRQEWQSLNAFWAGEIPYVGFQNS